jgi:hypothetical protein
MSTIALDGAPDARWYDGVRYHVPSSTRPHITYLVELTDYTCNGTCQCEHFHTRLGPLLSRRITPQQAIARKLVKVKKTDHPEDALRCQHIIAARRQFTDEVISAITRKFKRT